jgi:hypothetical protein
MHPGIGQADRSGIGQVDRGRIVDRDVVTTVLKNAARSRDRHVPTCVMPITLPPPSAPLP